MACGELGLDINYFYSLTPRQFNNILEGYRQKEEAKTKLQLELNRDIEWAITRQYLDTKNPQHPKTMQEYKQFVWEQKQDVLEHKKPKTKAEQRAYWQKIDKTKVPKGNLVEKQQ